MEEKNKLKDENVESPAQSSAPKHMALKSVLPVLVAILIAGAGIYGVYSWQHSKVESLSRQISATSDSASSQNKTASSTASKTSLNETVTTPLDLQYEKLGQSVQNYPVTLSVVVPLTLRTQITNSECINGDQGGPAGSGSVLEECLHLSFADVLGSGDSLTNSSYMSVWDGFSWLTRDEDDSGQDIVIPPFGLTTVAQKQKAWGLLSSLTPTTNMAGVASQLPYISADAASVSGNQHITFVQSADGSLKGFAYVATLSQDGEAYNPYVYYVMGGTIGSQPILISGQFRASDQTEVKANDLFKQNSQSPQAGQLITQASGQLSKGVLSSQTAQAFNEVMPILKSITIKQAAN
jgi:hypothetical protein